MEGCAQCVITSKLGAIVKTLAALLGPQTAVQFLSKLSRYQLLADSTQCNYAVRLCISQTGMDS